MTIETIIAALIFGSIGLFGFMVGKRRSNFLMMMVGVALMAYPYFISNTIILFVVGVVLTAALWYFWE